MTRLLVLASSVERSRKGRTKRMEGSSTGVQPEKSTSGSLPTTEKGVVSRQARGESNSGDRFIERVLQEKAELEEEMQKCQERQARLTAEAPKRNRAEAGIQSVGPYKRERYEPRSLTSPWKA